MSSSFSRNTVCFCVFIGSLLLSGLAAWQAHNWQKKRNIETFSYTVRESFLFIEKSFEAHNEVLKGIGSYFLASDSVTSDEFDIFTDPHLKPEKGYAGLGWIDVSPAGGKIKFLRTVVPFQSPRRGIPDEKSPLAAVIREAQKTRTTAYYTGSDFFGWSQIVHKEPFILSVYPVYSKKSWPDAPPEGFSFSIMDVKSFVENVIDADTNPYISLGIMATIEQGTRNLLYQSPHKPAGGEAYKHIEKIKVGGQFLYFTFYPTQKFMDTHSSSRAYILFIGLYLMLSTLSLLYLRQLRSHMDKLLRSQKKAEEASRLKDDFLATMSHEIRSPMSGVLGMAELLLNTPLTPEQKSHTRTILNSGEILLNIIEDILDVSKIEANKLTIDPIEINMVDLVHDVSALYAYKAQEKAIELAVRYTPGCQQYVIADPVRIRQILGNLINNALKFTEKGHVTLTVREDFKASLPEDKVQLVFAVEDTGIGIQKESLEKIFEKFSQADSSTTRRFGGTGLGLSICKKLTNLMEGDIAVTSEVGRGSTFTFSLPLKRSKQKKTQHLRPSALQGIKILIVDDLPVLRTLIREQLNLSGLRCDAAENGEEALAMMKSAAAHGDPYSIALIDYLMPDMNGEKLAEHIKGDAELQQCCLIMVTTAGGSILSNDFSEKGFSALFTKPVNIINLITTLAVVWQKYQSGHSGSLIHVDAQPLNTDGTMEDFTLNGARVLVAEDSRLNQAFVEDVLAQLECEVKIVLNGLEALKALQQGERFHLVLMDCQMPVMDGFEATRQICALKAQGVIPFDLPIVALTANAMEGDRRKCLDAGMDDYLSKPVRVRDLKRKIYQWLRPHVRPSGPKKKEQAPSVASIPLRTAQAEPGLIDFQALGKCTQTFGARYSQMVDIFLEDTQNFITEADQAVKGKHFENAIRPFHTIKSASLRMGAVRLGQCAAAAERALRTAEENKFKDLDKAGVESSLSEMIALFEKTKVFFEGDTASRAAGNA